MTSMSIMMVLRSASEITFYCGNRDLFKINQETISTSSVFRRFCVSGEAGQDHGVAERFSVYMLPIG